MDAKAKGAAQQSAQIGRNPGVRIVRQWRGHNLARDDLAYEPLGNVEEIVPRGGPVEFGS